MGPMTDPNGPIVDFSFLERASLERRTVNPGFSWLREKVKQKLKDEYFTFGSKAM